LRLSHVTWMRRCSDDQPNLGRIDKEPYTRLDSMKWLECGKLLHPVRCFVLGTIRRDVHAVPLLFSLSLSKPIITFFFGQFLAMSISSRGASISSSRNSR
jgi:hypothetical protein